MEGNTGSNVAYNTNRNANEGFKQQIGDWRDWDNDSSKFAAFFLINILVL